MADVSVGMSDEPKRGVYLGKTLRLVMSHFNISRVELAERTGVTPEYVARVEHSEIVPVQWFVDRVRAYTGVDLHILAWTCNGDVNALPKGVRPAAMVLNETWRRRYAELVDAWKQREDDECPNSPS